MGLTPPFLLQFQIHNANLHLGVGDYSLIASQLNYPSSGLLVWEQFDLMHPAQPQFQISPPSQHSHKCLDPYK